MLDDWRPSALAPVPAHDRPFRVQLLRPLGRPAAGPGPDRDRGVAGSARCASSSAKAASAPPSCCSKLLDTRARAGGCRCRRCRTRRTATPSPLADQPPFPGNLDIEAAADRRWCAGTRWRWWCAPTSASGELGGHIASYASAADLFEVGFNHFFRAGARPGGDLVFFQPHSAPGVYARAFLEGRLERATQLDALPRAETARRAGLSLAIRTRG
ncbi:MAG: hypothetical protein MZW92_58495 [Comamonadaceae bacterium]|nr:hypothetical protein [Comamonadaceae bacterium]